MPATSTATRRDRFVGCLLGGAVGDGLGSPWEGLTSFDILHLGGPPHVLVTNPTAEILFYTDDTEMTVGVAETLVEHGEILADPLVRAFARNYHHERGYGRGARRILEAVQAGDDWDTLADTVFPGGSLGNGAAMRIAPVGLLFADDLDRVWEQARLSALPTHRHPVGMEAAQRAERLPDRLAYHVRVAQELSAWNAPSTSARAHLARSVPAPSPTTTAG